MGTSVERAADLQNPGPFPKRSAGAGRSALPAAILSLEYDPPADIGFVTTIPKSLAVEFWP